MTEVLARNRTARSSRRVAEPTRNHPSTLAVDFRVSCEDDNEWESMIGGLNQSLTCRKCACVPTIPAPSFDPAVGISLVAKLKLPHLFINSEFGDQRREND